MSNRIAKNLTDHRSHARVKENKRITWKMRDTDAQGSGRIRNISTSGMLLEARGSLNPSDEPQKNLFSFDADLGSDNFIPQTGRLKWVKRKKFSRDQYYCGIEFVNPAEYVFLRLHERVQKRVKRDIIVRRTTKVASALFFTGLIALLGYLLYQSHLIYQSVTRSNAQMVENVRLQSVLISNYATRNEKLRQQLAGTIFELTAMKELYAESEVALTEVSKELEATKAILAQTEMMLNETQTGSIDALQADRQQFEQKASQLAQEVEMLEGQKVRLTQELLIFQKQLDYYEGNIENIREGQDLISFYLSKLKSVKHQIRQFKQSSSLARRQAQVEDDRIRMILGNNGFLVKDGQAVVVDEQLYKSATLPQEGPSSQIKIDVRFVD